jgi:3-methyladenine DNA glycosylase AlkC
MSTLLKDKYSVSFYEGFLDALDKTGNGIPKKQFFDQLMDSTWEEKSLKERMRHTTIVWRSFLVNEVENQAKILIEVTNYLKSIHSTEYSLEYLFLADFIVLYMIDYPELAIKTMEEVTTFTSCEFAIRPFIIRYPSQFEKQMFAWSNHSNHHVRRLASEGIRPKLPWGEVLRTYVKEPAPIFPILDNLIADPSEYVRRSVANILNDISKTHPDLVLDWSAKKYGVSKEVNQAIKHGIRTLLKQGNSKALSIIGIKPDASISVISFELTKPQVKMGGELPFSLVIKNTGSKLASIRVEYKVYFKRLNKPFGEKVFQITSTNLAGKTSLTLERKHSFKPITTRNYYPGEHYISLIVNGEEGEKVRFEVE